jgi:adenosine deaminase
VKSDGDPALMARLKQSGMPLTVCPLSNTKLMVFKKMEEHNLKRMLDAGIKVMVNSDDPAYFGGYVLDNYLAVTESLNLSKTDLKALAANSITASFLPDAQKAALLSRLDAIPA